MNIGLVLKLLHVGAAFWLIAGIIGRTVVMSRAQNSTDFLTVRSLMPLAAVFERRMVIPGSSAVLVAGLLTAWVQHWPILGFLQGRGPNWVLVSLVLMLTLFPVISFIFLPRGKVFEKAFEEAAAQDQVTLELSAAFRDPIIRAAHVYELVVLVVIVALMVLKPF
jgi:hypothetical protein